MFDNEVQTFYNERVNNVSECMYVKNTKTTTDVFLCRPLKQQERDVILFIVGNSWAIRKPQLPDMQIIDNLAGSYVVTSINRHRLYHSLYLRVKQEHA